MGIRITGLDTPFGGVSWEKTEGDQEIARRVITFLEDRRLLFGDRHYEDQQHCIHSALEIRAFLTEQVSAARAGKELEASLRAMRAAARRFVEAGGPDGVNFIGSSPWEAGRFGLGLGDLRSTMGLYLGLILSQYPMAVEDELASILPPADDDGQDLSWMVGFR